MDKSTKKTEKLRDILITRAGEIITQLKDTDRVTSCFTDMPNWGYVIRVINLLESEKFIKTRKLGKYKTIKFTKKGIKLRTQMMDLRRLLE